MASCALPIEASDSISIDSHKCVLIREEFEAIWAWTLEQPVGTCGIELRLVGTESYPFEIMLRSDPAHLQYT